MSNALNRTYEIRELLGSKEAEGIDPYIVSRVLKLCRMHDNMEQILASDRARLAHARKHAKAVENLRVRDHDKLVNRIHNQRQEIKRLQKVIDEDKDTC